MIKAPHLIEEAAALKMLEFATHLVSGLDGAKIHPSTLRALRLLSADLAGLLASPRMHPVHAKPVDNRPKSPDA